LADDDETPTGTLGRIALRQVRVRRDETQARETMTRSGDKPMNLLVPYLDLFSRLDDRELSRLARVDAGVVAELRRQVEEINQALARYVDLLPRLADGELARLTGASGKTIRFWRLCQPRATVTNPARATASGPASAATAAARHGVGGEGAPGVPVHASVSRTPPPVSDTPALAVTNIAGQPFPGFEGERGETDESGYIELAIDEEQPTSSGTRTERERDEDDLAFELSDDDFF